MWRNKHNNTGPNAIWFPDTLNETNLNNQGIQVKYRTNVNCYIPWTESRLWGTKWYYLISAPIRMLRRGAFGIFYTTIFNWTFKNFVPRRGSSKVYTSMCLLICIMPLPRCCMLLEMKLSTTNSVSFPFCLTIALRQQDGVGAFIKYRLHWNIIQTLYNSVLRCLISSSHSISKYLQ